MVDSDSSAAARMSRQSLVPTAQQRGDGKSVRGSISSSADDSVSHFFAIETRLALQERLVALQQRLQELLVRTKLAWMKCFAAPAHAHESNDADGGDVTTTSLDAAQALVHQGEALMHMLERAFTAATATVSCPILAYSELVESAERDFAAFEALVERTAQLSFQSPHARVSGVTSPTAESAPPAVAAATAPSISTRHAPQAAASGTVQYDLPSMQSYCAKVAPPYSSYLPAHKTLKSRKS